MNFFVHTANAENKLRKTNKCKNKINYKNILKGKNNQTKTWKWISINIEECASKCTDQITLSDMTHHQVDYHVINF